MGLLSCTLVAAPGPLALNRAKLRRHGLAVDWPAEAATACTNTDSCRPRATPRGEGERPRPIASPRQVGSELAVVAGAED